MKPIQDFTCRFCNLEFNCDIDEFESHTARCDKRPKGDPATCTHEIFFAFVNVARIEDKNGFYAEFKISCDQCATPFHFVGVPGGLSPRQPRCDPFGFELRAPIKPGALPFPIRHSNFEMMPDKPEADVSVEGEQ